MTDRPSAFEPGIKCVPIEESTVDLPHNSVKSSDEILTELFGSFNAKPPDSLESFHYNRSNKHHKKNKKRRHLSHKHKRKPKSKKNKRHNKMSTVGPQTCRDRPSDIAENFVSRRTSVNSEETCFDKKGRLSSVEDNFVSIGLPILNQNVSPINSCSEIEVIQQATGLVGLDVKHNRPSSVSSTPSPQHNHSVHPINATADTTIVHITDKNRPTCLKTNETLVSGMEESSTKSMLVEDKNNYSSIINVDEDQNLNLPQIVTDIGNTEEIISPVVSCEGRLGLETRNEQTPSSEVINEMVKKQKSTSASREQSRSPVKKRKRSKECSPEQDSHKHSSKKFKHRNRSKSQEIDHHLSKNGKGNKAKNDNYTNRKKRSKSRDLDHKSKDRKRRSRSVEKSARSSDRKKNRSSSRDKKVRGGDKKRRSKSCDERIHHDVNYNKGREGSGAYHRVKGKRSRSRDRERRKRSISRERSSDRKNTKKQKARSVSKDKKTQRISQDRSRSRDRKQSTSADRSTNRKRKSTSQNRSAEKNTEQVSRERSTSRSKTQAGKSHIQNPAEQIITIIMEPENPNSVKEIQSGSNDIIVPGPSNQSISPSIDKVEQKSESENPVSVQIDSKDILNKDLDSDQSKRKDQINNHDEDKCRTVQKKSHRNNRKSRSKSPIKDSHQRDRKRRSKSTDSCSHHSRPKRKSRSRSHNKDCKKSDKRRRSKSNGDSRRSDRKSRSKSRSRQKSNRIKNGKSNDREDHSKNKTRSKSKDAEGRNANRKSLSKSRDKDRISHQTDKRSQSKSRDKDKSSHRTDKRSQSKSRDKDKSSHGTDRRSRSKSRDKDKSSHRPEKRNRSKSRDKDKSSHRTDKRSRSKSRDKDKSSHGTEKRSRSKSRDKDKSSHRTDKRSRSKSRDKDKSSHRTDKRSRSKSRDKDKSSHRADKRSRSKSPDRGRRNVRKRRSRSREVHIDKRKLFEIARKNAMSMLKQAAAPFATTENIVTIKAGGKSVEELTDFCKQLSKKEAGVSSGDSDDDGTHHSDSDIERPFHHPFQLKERPTNIVLNIRNSVSVPTKTFQEKTAEQSKQLRLQFPVSSGQNHRKTESEWVPVASGQPSVSVQPSPSTSQSTSQPVGQTLIQPISTAVPSAVLDAVQTDSQSGSSVFPPAPASPPDIGNIVEKRVNAMRKLTANPNDSHAMSQIYQVNQQMSMWLASKQQPGQFTGSTGAKVLTAAQLGTGYQAWAKKAAPVSPVPLVVPAGGTTPHRT